MWPPEALEFLRELEDNNDTAWFRRERHRYEQYLVAPARELAGTLSDLGTPRFFRPYNNLRFRPGPPLKEHLAFGIGFGPAGGYYIDLSLDGLLVGAGLFHPAPDQLERYRSALGDDTKGRAFQRGLARAGRAGLAPPPPDLKRAPQGYPSDHPRAEHLRRKRLVVAQRHPLGPWLHEPGSDERVRAQLRAARPLVKWLAGTVGPSTQPERRR